MPWPKGKPRATSIKQCAKCNKSFPRTTEFFRIGRIAPTQFIGVKSSLCRSCMRLEQNRWSRERDAHFKRLALKHYGQYCACCKEWRIEFLTLDHIDGSGGKLRKENWLGRKTAQWAVQNRYPPVLRTLCWNCHMARNGGRVCPHDKSFIRSIK